jgi:hypothetical protein
VHRRVEVDCDLGLAVRPRLGLPELHPALNPSVVDEDVQLRMLPGCPAQEVLAALGLADVACVGREPRVTRSYGAQLALVATTDDDLAAGPQKALRESEAYAGGSSRDEDGIRFEFHQDVTPMR